MSLFEESGDFNGWNGYFIKAWTSNLNLDKAVLNHSKLDVYILDEKSFFKALKSAKYHRQCIQPVYYTQVFQKDQKNSLALCLCWLFCALQVFHSIQRTCMELLKVIEQYQRRICCTFKWTVFDGNRNYKSVMKVWNVNRLGLHVCHCLSRFFMLVAG